ncbi:hypothetical protein VI817_006377 [Penicillium citrinum]|nr:hypothetical protein VI817_006377 [Penicillium citrinum]
MIPSIQTTIAHLFDQSSILLNACSAHSHCHPGTSPLPTRVLDVQPDPDTGKIRLCEAKGKSAPYTTLSYIWGGPQPLTTTKDTLSTHVLTGFNESDAPLTIRDAVQTTRNLGLRYLWIDALCIIQDDDDDKNREIARMRDIYKRSSLTIVAAGARSVHEGFLHCLRPLDCDLRFNISEIPTDHAGNEDAVSKSEHKIRGMLFIRRRAEATTTIPRPVDARAWTLGERLLSPRILVFGTDSLTWQCREDNAILYGEAYGGKIVGSERLPINLLCNEIQREPSAAIMEAELAWSEVLADYGDRGLAFSYDKLIALAGVAEEFHRVFGGRYLAGLWERKLAEGLLWMVHTPRSRRSGYKAPSWSWASVDGEILTLAWEHLRDFEVLDCQVDLAVKELPFGAVDGGYIKVKGLMRAAKVNVEKKSLISVSEGGKGDSIGNVNLDYILDSQSGIENSHWEDDCCLRVCCIQIAWGVGPGPVGLVMLPVRDGVYRRLAKFTAPGRKDWFLEEGLQMQEIVIQ